MDGQLDAVFPHIGLYALHIVAKAVLHHGLALGQLGVEHAEDRQQIGLRFGVVDAVHQQQIRRQRHALKQPLIAGEHDGRSVRLGREVLGVVIPVAHMDSQRLRAVCALPDEFRGHDRSVGTVRVQPAAEDEIVDAEALEDLGKLGDVAELVGRIADRVAVTEGFGDATTLQQVADRGFARGQIIVVLQIPGADHQAFLGDVLA